MFAPLHLAAEARPHPAFVSGPAKQLFIGGAWVPAASGDTLDTIDPTTQEKITSIASADASDVDRAVKAARRVRRSLLVRLDSVQARPDPATDR